MTRWPQPSDLSPGGAETTLDHLLDGRVRLHQPARGYRAAIDPVFLAAAVEVRPGEQVLDLGCGVGAAALCLLAREPEAQVTGLEIQGDLAELARANARENSRADRFSVVHGDLRAASSHLEAASFDRVMMNPPYVSGPAGRPSPVPGRDLAQREGESALADWLAAVRLLLKPKGTVTVIHRADRAVDLMAGLHGAFGEIRLFPLWPAEGKAAKRVIVAARKGVSAPGSLPSGLVLHQADGGYAPAAEAVLRDAAALPW